MAKNDNQGLDINDILKKEFDEVVNSLINGEDGFSEESLRLAIKKMAAMRDAAAKHEKEEKRRFAEAAEERRRLEAERVKQEEADKKAVHVNEVTSMELPLDWENVFAKDASVQGVRADSISDGLILSLTNLGRVDIEYISSVTAEEPKAVITALRGSIFQNPDKWEECFYKGWETADEYLAGNLLKKYRKAREANQEYNGYFGDNVKALERIMPTAVDCNDIYVTIGSPWVPSDIIDEFINYLFGAIPRWYYGTLGPISTHDEMFAVKHDEITGTWEIPEKNRYGKNVDVSNTYGTSRLNALHLIEKALNMQAPQVMDEVPSYTNKSGKARVLNQQETILALEKQAQIVKIFRKWIWRDPERKARLEEIYAEKFASTRRRLYDGAYLTFPGMSENERLYPYQKNAVARILFSPNTLLAHDVGSGKTYVMAAAGMELKRMGLSSKNLFVVPNNIVGQWQDIFLRLYPDARLLTVSPRNFTPAKRQDTLAEIRDGEFDGIIMAYSCFNQIPLSLSCKIDALEALKDEITEVLQKSGNKTNKLQKKLEKTMKELQNLKLSGNFTSEIFFDELGITRLFVDEAHNFKNLPIDTKNNTVLGISNAASDKCSDMLDKVRLIQRNNDGGGVVMATGTPITNSITDAYIIQTYLQSGELAMLGLQSFDSWIGMFAERRSEFEVDVDTSKFRLAERFSGFHNLPELTTLLANVADFHQVDRYDGIPEFKGYNDALIAKTPPFEDYLEQISMRADDVRSGAVSRKDDNMLKITTDGRKAALDLRLVDPCATFSYQYKVMRCAENIINIYRTTAPKRLTQLVFCDTSTPKSGFNLYDELKRILVSEGVAEEEIAYVHSYNSDSGRAQLFDRVRRGDIRVLMGSTFKLGLGVNVQDKLIAVHHLDVPWRPADMTQREGRILRQGNLNPQVYIFRYITEGSFDAYSWQLLETKQRFICDLLAGSLDCRNGGDIDEIVLNYAEVKSLAIGNPLIKKRVETANELNRYLALQRKTVDARLAMEKELEELPVRMEELRRRVAQCRLDVGYYVDNKTEYGKAARQAIRDRIREAVVAAMQGVLSVDDDGKKETPVLEYQGFTVLVPVNMHPARPYVYLQREGKYYVELGDNELGIMPRLDNCLEGLKLHLEKLIDNLAKTEYREQGIRRELEKNENYTDKIEKCRERLRKIDKQLGVDNDER